MLEILFILGAILFYIHAPFITYLCLFFLLVTILKNIIHEIRYFDKRR